MIFSNAFSPVKKKMPPSSKALLLYSRADLVEAHRFKKESMKSEERFRDYHSTILAQQKASKRHPRNTILADETPRSQQGRRDTFSSSMMDVDGEGSGHIHVRVPEIRTGAGDNLHYRFVVDPTFSRGVAGLRKKSEEELKRLHFLQAHLSTELLQQEHQSQRPEREVDRSRKDDLMGSWDGNPTPEPASGRARNSNRETMMKFLRASAVTELETSPSRRLECRNKASIGQTR